MHTLELVKPDGRGMTLYARRPLPAGLQAPSPFPDPLDSGAQGRFTVPPPEPRLAEKDRY